MRSIAVFIATLCLAAALTAGAALLLATTLYARGFHDDVQLVWMVVVGFVGGCWFSLVFASFRVGRNNG